MLWIQANRLHCGNGLGELRQMPVLMAEVVFYEKTQRNRPIAADRVACRQPLLGNPIHHGRKNLMLHLPPIEQRGPGLARIAVRGHPGVLPVLRSGGCALRPRAHKALAVVGRRIEQVPNDLLARPSAVAPGADTGCSFRWTSTWNAA